MNADQPDHAADWLTRAGAHFHGGRVREAIGCLRHAVRLDPRQPDAWNNLGGLLLSRGQTAEAVRCLETAVELGEQAEAVAHCRKALECDPRDVDLHCLLAHTLRDRLPEEDYRRLLALLEGPALAGADRAALHFAVGTVHDSRGEHAAAARHIEQGNARQRAHLARIGQAYDPQAYGRLVDGILERFDAAYFRRTAGFGRDSDLPVFVVGMPRSGTTLTERILASHPRAHGVGERPFVANDFAAMPVELNHPDLEPLEVLPLLDDPTARAIADRHLRRLRARRPDRRQDARELPVPRPGRHAVPQRPDHPLPARSARHRAVLLDDLFHRGPLFDLLGH